MIKIWIFFASAEGWPTPEIARECYRDKETAKAAWKEYKEKCRHRGIFPEYIAVCNNAAIGMSDHSDEWNDMKL